jgi:WD40 repeat protein
MGEIFISHSSADETVAGKVAEALRQQGHNVFLDSDRVDGIAPGDAWSRTLFHRLRVCDAVVFLNSAASQASMWCHTELTVATDLGKRSYGLDLSPEIQPYPAVQSVHGIKLRASLEESTLVLLDALRRDGLAGRSVARWDERRAPYPGLEALDTEDSGVFFGREADVDRLVERVSGPLRQLDGDLVVVVGPSGAGKSSLVRAGLAARLATAQSGWAAVAPFEPGARPLDRLVKRLADVGDGELAEADCRERLSASGLAALAEWLTEHSRARAKRVLVVVDQAEQLGTTTPAPEREEFLGVLASGLCPGSPVTVVMTVRSDRFDEVQRLPVLGAAIHESFVVAPMDRNQLGAIIEGPARRADLSFDPGLVGRLIDDAMRGRTGEAVDSLPLLAFTLREMYNLAVKEGRRALTESDYEHVGRIEGAIARRARSAETLLGPEARPVLERLLPRFVTLSDERLPAGRPVARDQLSDTEVVIVQKLEDQRLLTGASDSVRLAHERLIVAWPTLAQAVAERQEDMLLQARLERQARDWKEATGGLLGRDAVGTASTWLDHRAGPAIAAGVVGEYVRKSQEALSRRRRVRAGALGVIVGLLVVSVLVSVLALISRGRADAEAAQDQSAVVAEEATNALTSGDIPLGTLLSIEARRRASTPQAADALAAAAAEPLVFTAKDPTAVYSVALSPNGHSLVTGDVNGEVVLYNLARAAPPIKHLDGSAVTSVAFSPDGNTFVTGDEDGLVVLYNLRSGKKTQLQSVGSSVWDLAFSPNGKALAVGDQRGQVVIYNLDGGKEASLGPPGSPVLSVAFSPIGKSLAAGDEAGQVVLYDMATGKGVLVPSSPGSQVYSLAFSPDGRLLAAGDYAGKVVAYRLADGKATKEGDLDDGSLVFAIAFSPNDKVLASADDGGQLLLLSLVTGATATLNDEFPVHSLAFSSDGRELASGDNNGQVLVYDMARVPLSDGAAVSSVSFSPDGKMLATGDKSDDVVLYDLANGTIRMFKDLSPVTSVAFSPDGKTLASGDTGTVQSPGQVVLWRLAPPRCTSGTTDCHDYQALYDGNPLGSEVYSLAFSPDGKTLASGTEGTLQNRSQVVLYSLPGGKTTTLNDSDKNPVSSVAFSGDGKTLAAGDQYGHVLLWHMESGKATDEGTLNVGDTVVSIAISPDGKWLAVGTYSGQIVIYDMTKSERKTTTLNDGSLVWTLAFSPDGEILASGDRSGQTVLYNMANGTTITLDEGDDVFGVAFSPDGSNLAAAEGNGDIALVPSSVWLSSFSRLQQRLCAEVGDANMTRAQWAANVPDQSYQPTCP